MLILKTTEQTYSYLNRRAHTLMMRFGTMPDQQDNVGQPFSTDAGGKTASALAGKKRSIYIKMTQREQLMEDNG